MQGTIKVIFAVVLLAAVTAAIPKSQCPKTQEVEWKIELLLPHEDCDKFYQCTHGKPVERPCPKDLFFNTTGSICDWRDYVDCGDRNIPEEEEPVVTTGPDNDSIVTEKPEFPVIEFLPNGCPVDPELHWLLPYERNCKFFYYCNKGKRELKQCPLGLHFNKERQICDWRWNADC